MLVVVTYHFVAARRRVTLELIKRAHNDSLASFCYAATTLCLERNHKVWTWAHYNVTTWQNCFDTSIHLLFSHTQHRYWHLHLCHHAKSDFSSRHWVSTLETVCCHPWAMNIQQRESTESTESTEAKALQVHNNNKHIISISQGKSDSTFNRLVASLTTSSLSVPSSWIMLAVYSRNCNS
mgnify:CR=1 FL=1